MGLESGADYGRRMDAMITKLAEGYSQWEHEDTMSDKRTLTIPPHLNLLIDELSERSHLTRSEIVRQAIILVNNLTTAPYNQTSDYHAIRSIRAQIGTSDAYRQEYPNG